MDRPPVSCFFQNTLPTPGLGSSLRLQKGKEKATLHLREWLTFNALAINSHENSFYQTHNYSTEELLGRGEREPTGQLGKGDIVSSREIAIYSQKTQHSRRLGHNCHGRDGSHCTWKENTCVLPGVEWNISHLSSITMPRTSFPSISQWLTIGTHYIIIPALSPFFSLPQHAHTLPENSESKSNMLSFCSLPSWEHRPKVLTAPPELS